MSIIYNFIKFTKKEYVKDFLDGNMRFTPLDTYKEYKNKDEEYIGDKFEGATAIFNDGKYICIDGKQLEGDIESAVLHNVEEIKHMKAMCVYALHSHNIKEITNDNVEEYKNIFKIDTTSISKEYDTAIVIRVGVFIDLIKKACYDNENIEKLRGGLIEYIDRNYNGFINKDKVGFIKNTENYSNQKEYRFIVHMDNRKYPGVQIIKLGDIREICQVINIRELNEKIQIQLQ